MTRRLSEQWRRVSIFRLSVHSRTSMETLGLIDRQKSEVSNET